MHQSALTAGAFLMFFFHGQILGFKVCGFYLGEERVGWGDVVFSKSFLRVVDHYQLTKYSLMIITVLTL